MTSMEFGKIVEQICQYLKHLSETNPKLIAACKTGEDFEQCVFDATEATLASLGIQATVFYTPGSHVFPDIVVEFNHGEKYGIEVKSSTSSSSKNWKINGNSVLGSTKEDVIDTYIFRTLQEEGNMGVSSAVGLLQSCVGFVLVVLTNTIVKKINPDNALF